MLITLDPNESFHEAVASDAAEAGVQGPPLRAASWEDLVAHLDAGRVPGAVLIGPGVGTEGGTDLARRLADRAPEAIVLLVAMPTTSTLRAALRAGIRDVLPPSFSAAELGEALREAGYGEARHEGELDGLTIAVFSAKGGVGTSVLASNLSHRLAALTGADTILADLDLPSADQAVMHGLRPTWTMQDLADGTVGDDMDALDQVLLPVQDGSVRILAGPVDPAAAEGITDTAVVATLHRLRQLAPLVVADTSSAFTDVTLSVLEHADVIVLVVSLDVLSLRSLSVTLQTFDRLGIPRDRVRVAVMRSDAKVGLTVDDVARTTGADVDVAIPSSRDVARSVNTASPLAHDAPRSAVVKAVDDLVALITTDVSIAGGNDAAGVERRGLFGLRRSTLPAEPAVIASDLVVDVPEGTVEAPSDEAPADEAPTDEAATDGDPEQSTVGSVAPVPSPRRVRTRPVVVRRADENEAETDEVGEVGEGDGNDGDEHVAPVIEIGESSDRLAEMPPPVMDTTPATDTDTGTTKRRRRNARN